MQRRQLLRTSAFALGAFGTRVAPAAAEDIPIRNTAPYIAEEDIAGRPLARPYALAAQRFIGALAHGLGLPAPQARLLVYADVAEFELGLVEHLKLPVATAKATAAFAKAAVAPTVLLICHPAMASVEQAEREVTMAHEIVHLTQGALAARDGKPRGFDRFQWLTEGFAEWAAKKALDSLNLQSYALRRAKAVEQVKPLWQDGRLANLAQMDRFADWVKVRIERGYPATYPFAFLAVEFLVERHGLEMNREYFRRFATQNNPVTNFQEAFGETPNDFQLDLNVHLRKLFA